MCDPVRIGDADQLATTGSVYTSGGGDGIHSQAAGNFCDNGGPNCYRDHYTTDPLVWDFHRNALNRPDQLRQRVAFALSQILVVSALEVSGTYGFREYHNLLLNNAFGNYREILRKLTLSPLMGDYLGHVNNDKTSPNENYEDLGDMAAQPALADNQARTLLSGFTVPAARTPQQALDLVLDSLMAEPSMAPFIARQMIQQLTKSNPSAQYIRRVGNAKPMPSNLWCCWNAWPRWPPVGG